jgi:hypothetical protein
MTDASAVGALPAFFDRSRVPSDAEEDVGAASDAGVPQATARTTGNVTRRKRPLSMSNERVECTRVAVAEGSRRQRRESAQLTRLREDATNPAPTSMAARPMATTFVWV